MVSTMRNDVPHSVQVVSVYEEGFRFEKDAFYNILKNAGVLDKKCAVISTAGAFRKGKSLLNNLFINYLESTEQKNTNNWCNTDMELNKFHWRGGTEPDTRGIYMWSHPTIMKDKDGEEVAVFVMDTQGTFDSRSTVKQCATIFALSTMISSCQIFNVSMNIQEDDLQNLALFTEYAKLANANCQEKPFQQLLFLVRDWQNSEEYGYGVEGGQAFLKNKLEVNSDQAKELRELRSSLLNCFQGIGCFLMPHPGLKVANNNKATKFTEVEPDFMVKMKEFVEMVLGSPSLKTIAGKQITGEQFGQFFERYTGVFNSGEIPEPRSILQATADLIVAQAFHEATTSYDKKINTIYHTDQPDIRKLVLLHNETMVSVFTKFNDARKFGGERNGEKELQQLEAHISMTYENAKQRVQDIEQADTQSRQTTMNEEEQRIRLEQQRAQAQEEIRRMRLDNEEHEIRLNRLRNNNPTLEALPGILTSVLLPIVSRLLR